MSNYIFIIIITTIVIYFFTKGIKSYVAAVIYDNYLPSRCQTDLDAKINLDSLNIQEPETANTQAAVGTEK